MNLLLKTCPVRKPVRHLSVWDCGTYLTYPTFLELRGERVEPVLTGRQQFVLSHLPPPGLGGVAGSRLPGIRSDHLPQLAFLQTFLTNHR